MNPNDLGSIIKSFASSKANEESPKETTWVLLGQQGGGKTSILYRFLDKTDVNVNPGVVLDYTFARKTKSTSSAGGSLVHIYEISGMKDLDCLLDVTISDNSIHNTFASVVVNLNKFDSILNDIVTALTKLREHQEKIFESLNKRGSKRPKLMMAHSLKQFENFSEQINPICFPTIIICTHYDLISSESIQVRTLIYKILRVLALSNGCSLIMTSLKDEKIMTLTRQILNHHAFKTTYPSQKPVLDYDKPLFIPAGSDSAASIGYQRLPSIEDLQQEMILFTSTIKKPPTGLDELDFRIFPESVVDKTRDLKQKEFADLVEISRKQHQSLLKT